MYRRCVVAVILAVCALCVSLEALSQESNEGLKVKARSEATLADRVTAIEKQLERLSKTIEQLRAKNAHPDERSSDFQIKLLALVHTDAESVVKTVSVVVPAIEQGTLRLAAHTPTNTIVVSGFAPDLAVLEVLVLRLDESKKSDGDK